MTEVTADEVYEAIMTLIRYDEQFENHVPDRLGRTIDTQVGLIIRELGEFLDVEKHGKTNRQCEELVDYILTSSATLPMVFFRYKSGGSRNYELFGETLKKAVRQVDRKLRKRYLDRESPSSV